MPALVPTRPYNFSPGPAVLADEVLVEAAAEMLNWRGTGMGVMEMSHRGAAFFSIYEQALADCRELLAVPAHYKILFMQGGGLGENAIVPLNLSRGGVVDVLVTGSWSQKSLLEARKYCDAREIASNVGNKHTQVADANTWKLSSKAEYVHVCSNETIHGVELPLHQLPDLKSLGSNAPWVLDCSSHIGSCPIDWSNVGLAFAGAQKNLGPAGLTIVIVREDLLGHALPICPSAFDYSIIAKNDSMYNTPPTWAIYMAGLTFQWMKRQGGVAVLEQASKAKAELLYGCIDKSALYFNPVEPAYRSRMNVPFFLRDEGLNAAFLSGAEARGLLQLKGHKTVGGMRASLYNAMPLAGVQALVAYMQDFEKNAP